MYVCYKCKLVFNAVLCLIDHFKTYHGLNINDTYRCNQENCYQVFQNVHKFKAHLNRKHVTHNQCDI